MYEVLAKYKVHFACDTDGRDWSLGCSSERGCSIKKLLLGEKKRSEKITRELMVLIEFLMLVRNLHDS